MSQAYGTRSLREIVRIFFRHGLLIVLLIVLGAGGTYVACKYYLDKTYRSEISLIYRRPINKSPVSTDQAGERTLEVYVRAQQQIVLSDLVLARTMVISGDKLLRDRWYALRDAWQRARQREAGGALKEQQKIITWLESESGDGVGKRVSGIMEERQEDLRKFGKSVELETPGGEQVAMTATFTLLVDRPAKHKDNGYMNAYWAADVLADMYVIRFMQLQQQLAEPAQRVMDQVVERFVREDVTQARDRYDRFVRQHAGQIGVLEQLLKSGTEQGVQIVLSKVRENDASLYLDLARDTAIYEVLTATLPEKVMQPGGIAEMTDDEINAAFAVVSIDFLKENMLFAEMARSLAKLEEKRAKIRSQFTPESRDARYIDEQIREVYRRLLEGIATYARGLEAGIEARRRQREMHDELIRQTVTEQNETHALLAEYAVLKNDLEVSLRHLERLQEEMIDARSEEMIARQAATIERLDDASMPDRERPVIPMTILYTIVAGLVSGLIGVATAFLAAHFDHTLRSTWDAERYLGVPVVGSIKRRGRRLIVPRKA